uniref:Activating transcription factor 2 n=1 Tax=Oncorhynchus kisutch TaxID=8019 RepID=A0A8C7J225_ONCKI
MFCSWMWSDPKPTPTCHLKYCEEVGLFNELTSPMEHDFKIAAVDDIKKMPLDLSPLATPMIIHNKIEDHSAVAVTNLVYFIQDVAQPHCNNSTIVHPASLQVRNVLLATSDASVVIQQALPSPTSSSVITQASSSKSPIVPVSGTFPILFLLPNGQTMPVAIPATIASRALSLVPPEPRLSVPGSPRATSPCPWFPQSHISLSLVPPEPRLSVPGSPRATSLCPWFPQSHISLSLVPPEPHLSVPGSPRATSLCPWFPRAPPPLSVGNTEQKIIICGEH